MRLSFPADAVNMACGNCGKGEAADVKLKTCTACKIIKYCSRDCQVEHRPQHKEACKKRSAELFDEELFRDHPERPDCPICMLPFPADRDQIGFHSCCGQNICMGCVHAQRKEDLKSGKEWGNVGLCAFCRTHFQQSDEEVISKLKQCAERKNARAIFELACHYMYGKYGLTKNMTKAVELFLKSGEMGCAQGYWVLEKIYKKGMHGKRDTKKARHYHELAAIGGSVDARYELGHLERMVGDDKRAYKHYIIGAKAGHEKSMNQVKEGFNNGLVTNDEYDEAIKSYLKQQEDTKSAARDDVLVEGANPRLYRDNFIRENNINFY